MPKPDSQDAPKAQNEAQEPEAFRLQRRSPPLIDFPQVTPLPPIIAHKGGPQSPDAPVMDYVDGMNMGAAKMHGPLPPDPEGAADWPPAITERAETPHAASMTETETAMGDIPSTPPAEPQASDPVSRAKSLAASVMNRLKAEKRWFGLVDLVRDQMMREAKEAFPDLVQRQIWVYSELDRIYPSLTNSDIISESGHLSPYVPTKPISEPAEAKSPSLTDAGQIQGLQTVPEWWPELPSNASMGAEIGWVQANRLLVVEERPGKATMVRLERAKTPAPSLAALGWLETSIRSYAKYVDVAAKVSGGEDDEGAVMRAERRSVAELQALLREMQLAEGVCPHCGRPHE